MKGSIRQGGFTLIELVVVITILAILAAYAVPRFVAVQGEARAAARDELAGSVPSAAAMAHAMWLASGQPPQITMAGVTIEIANGYPSRATIDDALGELAGYRYAPGIGVFASDSLASCTVTYTEAPPSGVPTVVVSGAGTC